MAGTPGRESPLSFVRVGVAAALRTVNAPAHRSASARRRGRAVRIRTQRATAARLRVQGLGLGDTARFEFRITALPEPRISKLEPRKHPRSNGSSSNGRMQACGACDAGSIPAEPANCNCFTRRREGHAKTRRKTKTTGCLDGPDQPAHHARPGILLPLPFFAAFASRRSTARQLHRRYTNARPYVVACHLARLSLRRQVE